MKENLFKNCNKTADFQIFPVDFIFFLFSDYYGEIVNILIKYSKTMLWTIEHSFVWRHITKLNLSRLFKQETEWNSISTHFQNGSQIFKFVKNIEIHGTCEDHKETGSLLSRAPITIDHPRRKWKALSTTLDAPFNTTFKWAADICCIYSPVLLEILGSSLWLNDCRS